jgi:hypothetical protein
MMDRMSGMAVRECCSRATIVPPCFRSVSGVLFKADGNVEEDEWHTGYEYNPTAIVDQ